MYPRLHVATSANTADKEADNRFKAFLDEIYPAAEAAEQKLREKLLASGLEPNGFELPLKKMRAEADLYRDANLPLLTEERKLAMEYDKIVGAQTVQWEGEEVTLSRLRPVYLSDDRAKRGARAGARQRNGSWRIDRQSIRCGRNSCRCAKNLQQTPANAVIEISGGSKCCVSITRPPIASRFTTQSNKRLCRPPKRLYEKRRKQLGLQTLRPWDLEVDPLGRAPLKPFANIAGPEETAASIFHRVDSRFGEYYDTMVRESLLDLDNRKNKAPGAYLHVVSNVQASVHFYERGRTARRFADDAAREWACVS